MIFCYVSGTFGGYNQVLQPAILPEKTNYISIKSNTAKKKSPPCHSIKLETLKPRNSPPSIKSENPTKKPYKEPVLPCFSMVFLSAIFAVFCMFFFIVSSIILLVLPALFLPGKPQWGLSLWRRWDTSHQGKHNESPQREDITVYMILKCLQFVVGW